MVTVPIRIILQGLIALVPQSGPDGTTMTALVVNAMNTQNVDCYAAHMPVVVFPTDDCSAPCAEQSEGLCACNLSNQEISLLPVQGGGHGTVHPGQTPGRPIPFRKETAGDFAYTVNLGALGYHLDPVFRSHDPSTPLPLVLAARFQFPFDTIGACRLASWHGDGSDYVFAANLRPFDSDEDPTKYKMNQAVAESVEATVALNLDAGAAPILRLSPLPGRTGQVHDFQLAISSAGVEITLSNDRMDHDEFRKHADKPCADGVGRDFAFFYELAENKPASWQERWVPHAIYTNLKSVSDLYPISDETLCKKSPGKGPLSRPICTMATFN
jgi:hypothetical protein